MPSPRRNKRVAGFTLAELIVVIVVLGVVAAVAVPMVVGTKDMQASGAARLLAADLQYAQDYAVTYQQQASVTFSPGTESYSLANASGPLIHPMTKEAYVIDFRSQAGFESVDLVSASFGNNVLTFDELGAPSSSGTVSFRAGPHLYDVGVAAATGKVTVTDRN